MEYKPRRRPASSNSDAASFDSNPSSASRPRPAQSLREQYCAPKRGDGGTKPSLRSQYGASEPDAADAPRVAQPAREAEENAPRSSRSFRETEESAPRASRSFREIEEREPRSARFEEAGEAGEAGSAPRRRSERQTPSRPRPRRRRRDPLAVIVPILMALALLAAIVYTGSSWFISTMNKSTYCSNIFINGIDISRFSKEEGMQYVREQIEQQLNAVHTVSWQGSEWSFSAEDFGASIETDAILDRAWNIGHVGNIFDRSATVRELKSNPIYLTAPLVYDEARLDAYVDDLYNQLYVAPRDAQVVADLTNPTLAVESSQGQELDRDTARTQIINLLENNESSTVLPVLTLEPQLSTEQAMSTLELIVDYRTDTSARGYYGRFNVRKGLSYFYGMIVQPGEEISFNEVVGPRTKERGWQPGTEYIGGGKTQEAYGGGICQASTTLYGALLKAGMTIMERSPHSMTVSYVEPSIDAAVTETNSKDLRFRNDTANAITIYTEVTKEYASVQIYGVRPEYRYELESNVVSEDTRAVRISYVDDVDGTNCYYTDETKLYKKGRSACISDGWLVAYDWDTGEEVSRVQLSHDQYQSGTDIYWRGTHSRDDPVAVQNAPVATEAPTRAPDVAASFD